MSDRSDSIGFYLQQIGRIKLLTREEEISLSRQIAQLSELERVNESL